MLNNFGDGMVKQWQKLYYQGRLSATDKSLHRKDFVRAAQAGSFDYAVRLYSKADVLKVIQEFVQLPGPALEVIIDPDAGVYPMVGPRHSLRPDDHREFHSSRKKIATVKDPSSDMF